MFCEKCGAKIEDGSLFCGNCGEKAVVSETQAVSSQSEQTAQEVTAEQVQAEAVVEENIAPEAEEKGVFCANCGAQMSENDVFCQVCGARVNDAPEQMIADMGAEAPAKSSKLKKILPVAIILAAVLSVGAYAFPYISNGIAKLFLSPEKYFEHVVTNNLEDPVDNIVDAYETFKDNNTGDKAAKGELSVELGDDFIDVISDISGEDISEYIGWLENASIAYDSSVDGNKSKATLDFKINKTSIGSMETIIDMDEGAVYVGLPDYNDAYIRSEMYPYNDDGLEVMNQLIEALPEKKLVKKLLCRYIENIASSVDDVEEKKTTITANGVSQKVTSLSVEINEELWLNVLKNILIEARDDKDLEEVLESMSAVDEISVDYSDMVDAIDELIEEVDYSLEHADSEGIITIDIYVNGKGEIVGINIEDEYASLSVYTAEKGSKYGTVIEFEQDGRTMFSIEGGGKMSFGKCSGEFTLEVSGFDILTVELDKININKFKKGTLNGTVTIVPSKTVANMLEYYAGDEVAELVGGASLVIKSKSSSLNDLDYELIFKKEKDELVKLSVDGKTKRSGSVKVPTDYVDGDDYDDMEDWTGSMDIEKLIKNLEKAGLPDEFIEEMEDSYDYYY